MSTQDPLPTPITAQRIPYGDDPHQFGGLRLPPSDSGRLPVVVAVHGGFWRAAYGLEGLELLCVALTAAGIATWNVEYRRIGQPGGAWPGTLQDVGRAADHLRLLAPRYNLDLDRVVAVGHSAGGHLAAWLAARARIPAGDPLHTPDPLPLRATVPLAGVVDLRHGWRLNLSNGVVADLMGGAPDDLPARYATASPADLLPLGVRQVLIHGTADYVVPYEISRDYQARAVACGDDAALITLPDADHSVIVNPATREGAIVVETVRSLF